MKYICLFSVLFTFVALFILSCDDEKFGGPCHYHEIPGVAEIISVTEVSTPTYCDTAVDVRFDFIPYDISLLDEDPYSAWPVDSVRFMIGSGANPPRRWIEAVGLTVGTEHQCTRLWIYSGTCSPVIYQFDDIDKNSVFDSCDVWEQEAP